ncbi:DELLA protein 1-like [Lycium ferocissimum]|uniref:DELLA protein 1-like n=1 Tax=Lycium ferocissimum TaxID=112874 RepID=UPI0028153338|nr:DELLA protein 1-like [Lycium ferocissimum]
MSSSHARNRKKANQCSDDAEGKQESLRQEPNKSSFQLPYGASGSLVLSAPTIMKIAKQRLLSHISQKFDAYSIIFNPLPANSGLSPELVQDLDLAELLQASAQLVATRSFDRARKLLSLCNQSASATGTPVQKIVYYFADALQHRIDREMGKIPFTGEEDVEVYSNDVEEFIMDLEAAEFAKGPLYAYRQATQFTGIEAILDSTITAKKVHLIDLSIKSGSQWTTFMQVVADRDECPLEHLKISAVGRSKKMMEDVGRRLSAFAAETLINVSFRFKSVVSDLKNLKTDSFEVEADEVIAFYSDSILWTMLAWRNELESLMKVIKNLNPCIMVVIEAVANTNVPDFIDSFDKSLAYFSAIADTFEVHHKGIPICAEFYIQKTIRNMVTYHGIETVPRFGNLEVWRELFARFHMVETELSHSSLCQASLLFERSKFRGLCTFELDGKWLVISWKGTPFTSASAWKFQ